MIFIFFSIFIIHSMLKDFVACVVFAEEYFDSRMPYVMKRIAQGGIRLAMILNQVFGDSEEGFVAAT
jgi:hypothetical protein